MCLLGPFVSGSCNKCPLRPQDVATSQETLGARPLSIWPETMIMARGDKAAKDKEKDYVNIYVTLCNIRQHHNNYLFFNIHILIHSNDVDVDLLVSVHVK